MDTKIVLTMQMRSSVLVVSTIFTSPVYTGEVWQPLMVSVYTRGVCAYMYVIQSWEHDKVLKG